MLAPMRRALMCSRRPAVALAGSLFLAALIAPAARAACGPAVRYDPGPRMAAAAASPDLANRESGAELLGRPAPAWAFTPGPGRFGMGLSAAF